MPGALVAELPMMVFPGSGPAPRQPSGKRTGRLGAKFGQPGSDPGRRPQWISVPGTPRPALAILVERPVAQPIQSNAAIRSGKIARIGEASGAFASLAVRSFRKDFCTLYWPARSMIRTGKRIAEAKLACDNANQLLPAAPIWP